MQYPLVSVFMLIVILAPTYSIASPKVLASMNQRCIIQYQSMMLDGRPYFENMKASRKAFEAEMRKSRSTEAETNAIIKLYDGGSSAVKSFCECQSQAMYGRMSERVKELANRIVEGGSINKNEQQEYLKEATSLARDPRKEMLRCLQ